LRASTAGSPYGELCPHMKAFQNQPTSFYGLCTKSDISICMCLGRFLYISHIPPLLQKRSYHV
jgi:hypothetical protein